MNYFKLVFLVFLSTFIMMDEADAQSRKKKSEAKSSSKDKKSTVIVFGDDDDDEQLRNERKTNLKMINIKTSPFSFIRGHQLIEVEKELSSVISLQLGIGATFKTVLDSEFDFYREFLDLGEYDNGVYESTNFNEKFDISDFYNSQRVQKPGLAFVLSPRFFLDADGFEGQYISPTFTYRKLNFETPSILPNRNQVAFDPNTFDKESKSFSSISVRYGLQYLFDSNITADFFLGVGLRFLDETRQDLGYSNSTSKVTREFHHIKSTDFLFEFGVRIGYYF